MYIVEGKSRSEKKSVSFRTPRESLITSADKINVYDNTVRW